MNEVDEFLRESNAIEDIFDEPSFHDAQMAWHYLMSQDVLDITQILETHRILMARRGAWDDDTASMLGDSFVGKFRDGNVWVGRKLCPSPFLIGPDLQMKFCFETMRANPPPDWKALHIEYERIHPFFDGNGRTGRMFMNWTRIKRCGLALLIIKADERGEYYKWFQV